MAYDKTTGIPGSEDTDGGLHSCHPATIRIGYLSVTAIRYRPACAIFLSIRPGLSKKIRSYSMGVTKYLIVNSPGHSEKSISESDSFITSAFRSVISTSRSPFNPFNPSNRKAQASPFRDDLCLPSGVLRCLPNSSSHTTVNGTVWPAIPVNAVQDITSQWR